MFLCVFRKLLGVTDRQWRTSRPSSIDCLFVPSMISIRRSKTTNTATTMRETQSKIQQEKDGRRASEKGQEENREEGEKIKNANKSGKGPVSDDDDDGTRHVAVRTCPRFHSGGEISLTPTAIQVQRPFSSNIFEHVSIHSVIQARQNYSSNTDPIASHPGVNKNERVATRHGQMGHYSSLSIRSKVQKAAY